MQSSTLVVFRTFVMLACLVAAPAVAILGGSSWQEVVRTFESLGSPPVEEQTSQFAASRPVTPVVQIPAVPTQPAFTLPAPSNVAQQPETATASLPEPPKLPPTPPFWPTQGTSLAERLGGNSQSTIAANSPANLQGAADNRVVPASFEAPTAEGGSMSPSRPSFPAPPTPGRQNELIQQQLKSLGAQQFRLLSWGPDGKQFKFECKMSLDSNPRYIRFFQAVGDTQQAAMQGVLDQVDAWRRSMNRE